MRTRSAMPVMAAASRVWSVIQSSGAGRSMVARAGSVDKADQIRAGSRQNFSAARQIGGDDPTASCQGLEQDQRQAFIK